MICRRNGGHGEICSIDVRFPSLLYQTIYLVRGAFANMLVDALGAEKLAVRREYQQTHFGEVHSSRIP